MAPGEALRAQAKFLTREFDGGIGLARIAHSPAPSGGAKLCPRQRPARMAAEFLARLSGQTDVAAMPTAGEMICTASPPYFSLKRMFYTAWRDTIYCCDQLLDRFECDLAGVASSGPEAPGRFS